MDLPVGTVLGDTYRISRLIGNGGMGAIYEAAHVTAGKRVAIKMMSRELAAHPEALARFRREVKVTTELAHPNIVDVFDFGAAQTGEPYLVMEFLEGEDLEQRLEREGPIPLRVAVEIIKQVASALEVAHQEGVVHRDLKPGNVFLTQVADGGVFIKVVDFGISKVLKAATTKLTMARAVVGTPEYMSPEQAAGRVDHVDHRSDQWALAVLAWLGYGITKPRTTMQFVEGTRTAPNDHLGKPIFPSGEPYCPLDGLIYPVGQTRCDRDKTLLQVRCPKCDIVRDADIQTCDNCGLVLVVKPRMLVAATDSPPPGGAAVA
jgi:serine/threonine protein kinase